MLQMMLSQEVMAKAAQRMMKLLPYKDNSDMIKRAWHLYRTGHVYNVTIENNVLKGKVTDRGHTYEPTFRLKQAASSSCACTAVGLCPHNIALFLYAYNQIDAVGNLIRQWKEPTTKQKHVRRDEKQKHIQVTEQHKKDATPNGNIIDAWWNSFEKAYRRIPLDYITEEEQMRRIVHSFFQTFERPTAKKAVFRPPILRSCIVIYIHGTNPHPATTVGLLCDDARATRQPICPNGTASNERFSEKTALEHA